MLHGYLIVFLLLSSIFAFVHYVAVKASLYWYFWWFDIVMHFWGGVLLGLGVHALCTLSRNRLKPNTGLVILVLLLVTGTWEIFERSVGLFNPETYIFDTTKDIIIGFSGGLLAHIVLKKYTIGS